MYDVVIAMIPAVLLSFYLFGLNALITFTVAVGACLFFEYALQKWLLKTPTTLSDGSALITGILLALNLPSSLPIWMTIVGALFAIGIAKISFGGLGANIFNPALVGRVFLLVSFPVQMTRWPIPGEGRFSLDAVTGATALGKLKDGLRADANITELLAEIPSQWQMFAGMEGGSMGEVSVIALLIGGLYLLYRKVITWHIPVAVLGSMFVFSGIMWLFNMETQADPFFHIIAGGAILGAFFMATDMTTSPMSAKGMIIFGIGIGVITMLIRLYGAYPEGISFAILIMNAFVPLLDRYIKPRRFGELKKVKV
jgi:electron transport complex protein RnfD